MLAPGYMSHSGGHRAMSVGDHVAGCPSGSDCSKASAQRCHHDGVTPRGMGRSPRMAIPEG